MPVEFYEDSDVAVYKDYLNIGPFTFVHDAADAPTDAGYVLSGHIHPGVKLAGQGRQSVKIPAFIFGKNGAVMPAFSKFTGLYLMRLKESDKVFGVVGEKVVELV